MFPIRNKTFFPVTSETDCYNILVLSFFSYLPLRFWQVIPLPYSGSVSQLRSCLIMCQKPHFKVQLCNPYFLAQFHSITKYLLPIDACKAREDHHIVGKLVGCLPRLPRQNVSLGLPVELLKEEAKLLLTKGICNCPGAQQISLRFAYFMVLYVC